MESSLFDNLPESKPKKKAAAVYSVSQLTAIIKVALENSLPSRLTVSGQVSGFRKQVASGHCYFDLKDETAILPCVMWKSAAGKLKFDIENGMAITARGYIDVYPPHGKYQFIADSISVCGIGQMQIEFEKLKQKLYEEGLFDEANKKQLPKYPFRIAILTSSSGAALHDIVDSISARWPVGQLFFYDVPVQGAGAAEKIAAAISDINKRNSKLKLDLLIVGRGGGAMEDLWEFNKEILARAIFKSDIPVVSAVGHEIDFTIADFVADARASTPTKAGVIAVPDIEEVSAMLESNFQRIKNSATSLLDLQKQKLSTVEAAVVFKNPAAIVSQRIGQIDELENAVVNSVNNKIVGGNRILQKFFEKIIKIEPHRILADRKIAVNGFVSKLQLSAERVFIAAKQRLQSQFDKLSCCDPKSVLNRGFSITRNSTNGKIVKTVAEIDVDDIMITEFADSNTVASKVVKKG